MQLNKKNEWEDNSPYIPEAAYKDDEQDNVEQDTKPVINNTIPVEAQQPHVSNIVNTTYIPTQGKTFLCPFCMRDISPQDLRYYCRKCDKLYTEQEIKGLPRDAENQIFCCNEVINNNKNRLCPNCIHITPETQTYISDLRAIHLAFCEPRSNFRMCMTGYPDAGKTKYIAHLLNFLNQTTLPNIISFSFFDGDTEKLRDRIIAKSLNTKGGVAKTAQNYLEPLLFDIYTEDRSYVSAFYDIAGEDFRRKSNALATKCVWTARNIIMTIDATSLPGVSSHPRVKEHWEKAKKPDYAPTAPVDTYINFVENNYAMRKGLFKTNPFKYVKLAIVFTKMDLFYGDSDDVFPSILKRDSPIILEDSEDFSSDANAVNKAMIQWLNENGGKPFVRLLKRFPNVKIFGVSNGAEDENPTPVRILDPYLWLLEQNGVI